MRIEIENGRLADVHLVISRLTDTENRASVDFNKHGDSYYVWGSSEIEPTDSSESFE